MRRAVAIAVAAILGISLAACGATATSRPPTTVRAPEPPPRPPAEPIAGPARYVTADGGGWVGARGGVRLRAGADGITVASQPFASPIVRVAHLGSAWLFVTAAGEVLRAPAPLADAEVASTLGGAGLGFVVAHRRRLAIVDGRGDLWVGDGEGFARAPGEVPIVDAAFASHAFGVRIALPGRLARTNDGGRTWTPLALPDGAIPYEVTDAGADVLVRAAPSEQRFVVHESGEVERVAAEPVLDRPTPPAEVVAALTAFEGTLAGTPLDPPHVPEPPIAPAGVTDVVIACTESAPIAPELAAALDAAHVPAADLVDGAPVTLRRVAASATRTLVTRCEGAEPGAPCDAVLLGSPRGAVVIPMFRLLADTFADMPDAVGALALDGDRMALHVSSAGTEATTHAPPTDVVVTFEADGTTSTFELAVGWAPARRTLAVAADGRVGLAVVRGDRATFVGTDGSITPARVGASCRAP